jgi:hypothetical protein
MNVHVDRMTLHLSRLSAAEGRRLVGLIGDDLAIAMAPAPAGAIPILRVRVEVQPGEALESLAHRIVAQMLRGLVRAL